MENAGIFKKENRFGDLDTVLCTCEDELLLRYNIGDEISQSDDEDEIEENGNKNEGKNEENEKGNESGVIDEEEKEQEDDGEKYEEKIRLNDNSTSQNIDKKNIDKKNIDKMNIDEGSDSGSGSKSDKIKLKAQEGFYKCLEMMRERHNISDNSMNILNLLVNYTTSLRLLEGAVIMHTTQGSPVDLDEDGLYFIQARTVLHCIVLYCILIFSLTLILTFSPTLTLTFFLNLALTFSLALTLTFPLTFSPVISYHTAEWLCSSTERP